MTQDLNPIPSLPSLEDALNPIPVVEDPNPPLTTSQKIINRAGWIAFGLFLLIFFTIIKIPDDRIKGLIDGNIANFLSQKGITYSASETKLSYLFGISYTLKGVTLNFPSQSAPGHIDEISVSPSLLSLLIGKTGGSVDVSNAGGSLSASFSSRNTSFSSSFKIKKLDIGKLGVLPIAVGIQGSAVIDGEGSVSGDMQIPSSLDGKVSLRLSKGVIDPQTFFGFSVPRIGISEGTVEVVFDKSKATIKTFHLGKTGNAADDFQGTLTGDVTLGKQWESSTLNLKTHFTLSENIMKAFILLDTILGSGKQLDGSYAFSLGGGVLTPFPTPIGAGDK